MKDNLWEEIKLEQSRRHGIDGVETVNPITKKIKIKLEKKECENIWKKNCPNCNTEIIYKNKKCFSQSKTKTHCRKCVGVGIKPWNVGLSKHNNSTIENYSNKLKDSWKVAKLNGRTSWNKGLSKETDKRVEDNVKKMSIGLKIRYETSPVWNKGKSHLPGELNPSKRFDVRRKLREACLRRLKIDGKSVGVNDFSCKIFNKINESIGLNGQHASNIGEKQIAGRSLDYYEPNIKLIIEWDESHHFKTKNKNLDLIRQNQILNELGSDWTFLRWDVRGKKWRTDLIHEHNTSNFNLKDKMQEIILNGYEQ